MRRSCAPSMKNLSSTVKSDVQKSASVESNQPIVNKLETPPTGVALNITHPNSVFYTVLWSKPTTKKHKTWEGDGVLEINKKSAILKDLTGTILGTSTSIKLEDIFEGNQLQIGSKEIEIQEKITEPLKVVYEPKNTEKLNDERSQDKKRKPTFHTTTTLNLSLPIKTRKLFKCNDENIEPLILPQPSFMHQWKFNEDKLTLTEVKVANSIARHLRPHQRDGVIFLYECILGMKDLDNFGAILADDMGLGKTLQCLALCCTLLKQGPYGNKCILRKILIVTPSSLVGTWNKEITKWLGQERIFAYVVDVKNKIKQYSGQNHIPFVIVSYETLASNCDDFGEISFDLLICDEGHRLKNPNTKVLICLKQLKIQRKIILSGTPIQNDLQEFYTLIDFVNPGILGEYREYKQTYENPIVTSQAPDVSDELKHAGTIRAEELNRKTSKFVLRRTQSIINEYLPMKKEYIVFLCPSELQQFMINETLKWYESKQESCCKESISLQIITALKKICNHPSLIRTSKQDSELIDYIKKLLPDWSEMGIFDSSKLEFTEIFLKNVITEKEKIVLVSNHTTTLDMLMNLCDHSHYKYLRLDGTTPTSERTSIVEKFNKNNDYNIFLLSSKAGGVGLNLSGASKLLIFDIDWNPATDLQAMSRIYRDGQKKNVQIYRLITAGTIEEKIFQRQIAKTSLSGCVINQANHKDSVKFSDEELKDLFSIQENFNICATHDMLNCHCDGIGWSPSANNMQNEANTEDPFQIQLKGTDDGNKIQLNELKKWQHFKSPISLEISKDMSILGAEQNIIFIFSNETNNRESCDKT